MKQKLISILALLLMAATGAWAEIITWDASNVFNQSHEKDEVSRNGRSSATYEGITITFSGNGSSQFTPYYWLTGTPLLYTDGEVDSFTFTAPEGKKFCKIEINTSDYVSGYITSGGWAKLSDTQVVWNGTAANTVTTGTNQIGTVQPTSIVFYLDELPVTANSDDKGSYWATYYNANAMQGFTADANTTVFQAALSDNQLTMTEVANREIPAGKAVILKSSSSTIALTPATTTATLEGNKLQGTATAITNPGNAYVLNKGTKGVGFYKLSSTGTIGANKAYLTYSGAGAREYFLFEDETTGIEMPTAETTDSDAAVYDLQGRQVVNPAKGLYIVNGKKVFINK